MLNPQLCQRVFYISQTQSLRLLRTARLEKSDQVGNARPTFFMRFFLYRWARLRRSSGHPYLAPRPRFIASTGLNAELHQAVGRSPVLRGSGDFFYLLPMDQAEIDNWKTIAESMEAKGDTESWFYRRARAIADGQPDPMPNVSELMGGTAA